MIQAVLLVPKRLSHFIMLGPNLKNLKTSVRYPWDSVSKAFAISTATTAPLMPLLLQCRMVSITLIKTSCVYLQSRL
jgi:hypothetical protein